MMAAELEALYYEDSPNPDFCSTMTKSLRENSRWRTARSGYLYLEKSFQLRVIGRGEADKWRGSEQSLGYMHTISKLEAVQLGLETCTQAIDRLLELLSQHAGSDL
jgi:hypothetical protein